MDPSFLSAITWPAFAGFAVYLAGKGFSAWLEVRASELEAAHRLDGQKGLTTLQAQLEEQAQAAKKFELEVKTFIANARR